MDPDREHRGHTDREHRNGRDPRPFGISFRPLGENRLCVAVEGELDVATADQLRHALLERVPAGVDVFLDISAVDFIDSTGLAAVIEALHRARESGAQLMLRGDLQPQARRLLELTGVMALLPLECR